MDHARIVTGGVHVVATKNITMLEGWPVTRSGATATTSNNILYSADGNGQSVGGRHSRPPQTRTPGGVWDMLENGLGLSGRISSSG